MAKHITDRVLDLLKQFDQLSEEKKERVLHLLNQIPADDPEDADIKEFLRSLCDLFSGRC